jgi:protein EFR3
MSVSTDQDLPFKEVANQCEALLIGKQQKLSICMSVREKKVRDREQLELSTQLPVVYH